jgi:monofunctional glycosyltransferase
VSDDDLEKHEAEAPAEPDPVVEPAPEEAASCAIEPVEEAEASDTSFGADETPAPGPSTEPDAVAEPPVEESAPEAAPSVEAPDAAVEPVESPEPPPVSPAEPEPLPPPAPIVTPAPKPRHGRLRRLVTLVLLIAVFAPPVSVAVGRVVPPLFTELMVQRLIQGYGWDYQWRPLSRISPDLAQAAVASEDARFCSHHGFDFQAMQAAMRHNERRPNGRVKGGSTISQQTAKNVFLWPGRSYVRKGIEAWYTVLIETLWGKRRIMEVYLNVVEFGPGIYGAQAASQHYFHIDASRLSPAQAAHLIAVLPKPLSWRVAAPGAYVARRSRRIDGAIGTVRDDGLAGCVGR